ncbi:MAG: 3-oxoacyl-ACP reductase [Pseudomonadota bacterium]
MGDRYIDFAHTAFGARLLRLAGLPRPPRLHRDDSPARFAGTAVLAATAHSIAAAPVVGAVQAGGGSVAVAGDAEGAEVIRAAAMYLDADSTRLPDEVSGEPVDALIFDATGISTTSGLNELYRFFHPRLPSLAANGRAILIGLDPVAGMEPRTYTAMRALEGFVRSLAKELGRRGATAQLLRVADDAAPWLHAPLDFVLSARSAFVSGQVLTISRGQLFDREAASDRPLAGKVALVTGASRGIGLATANTLARDGAAIVGVDQPATGQRLVDAMSAIGGTGQMADISAADAPKRLVDALLKDHGGVDIVVHNAGITRDKTLARMSAEQWESVLEVNLAAVERFNQRLLERAALRGAGRIVCVASTSGIAGNGGQTNYGTSKAGIIGMVQALAPHLAKRGHTINAVAPGFIETDMTAAMPALNRFVARRMNAVSQGGLPQDVAETIAFFASPMATGVNGNVLRVCGQNIIGA